MKPRHGIALIAFTDKGHALARYLARAVQGEAVRCPQEASLAAWTALQFERAEALVFVGAAGIAVRALAPHVRHKAEDPAVVVVDEGGRWAVPLLSGHLGGANALAKSLAAVSGGTAVLTTATDSRSLFAVDSWARTQGLAVMEPEGIKRVSAKLLRGEQVLFQSAYPIEGALPRGLCRAMEGREADFAVSLQKPGGKALWLAPRVLVVGLGCRRGTAEEALRAFVQRVLAAQGWPMEAVAGLASIDAKKDEPGLVALAEALGWTLSFYSAAELRKAPGKYTESAFVEKTVGVGNVCERSAVLAGGALLVLKWAEDGMTAAVAERPLHLTWDWS